MLAHERLQAWKLSHELVLAVYSVTASFPKHELYGLTSLARRAAFSAAAKIAEGAAKRGSAEFRRFLDISIGSLAELAYTLRLCKDLGLLSADDWNRVDSLRRRAGYVTWQLYRAVRSAARKS